MNPALLLAAGAVALFAFAGRKKGNGGAATGGAEKDTTGTIPQTGGGVPAPTAEEAAMEAPAIQTVLQSAGAGEVPLVAGPLGAQAAEEGVLGLDADTFAYPTPSEWLSGWLTRYAYWYSYPLNVLHVTGAPFQLPVVCILEATCPAEYAPYRAALVRIHEAVLAGMAERGIKDKRWDAAAEAFV
jgi:hypothetical protein